MFREKGKRSVCLVSKTNRALLLLGGTVKSNILWKRAMWYTGPVKGGGMVSKLTKRALAASLKKLLAQKPL